MRFLRVLLLLCWAVPAVIAGSQKFEALLRQGLLALDRGDLASAVASLDTASRLQPADARVWLALAQTYRKLNRGQSARNAATRAASLAREDPLVLHGLAIFHFEADNWAEAAGFEARYAKRAPADREAWPRALSFHLQAGQADRVIALGREILQGENRADLRNLLGKAYESRGESDKGILELQEAIRLDPYQESYYFDLAYVLLLHQNFDVAIRVLEGARKTFDKSAQIELMMGVAQYGQRRFGEAVDSFLRAAALAPEIEQPYVFLARILNHAEARLPEVAAKFAAFVQARPESPVGHFLHAKALIAQLGASDAPEMAQPAEALLRKAIALNDAYWEPHFELGLLLERRQEFAKAAEELERSIRINPRNATAHYRLARVYDRLGQKQRAEAERALHARLAEEEKAAVAKHAAGLKRLELVVK